MVTQEEIDAELNNLVADHIPAAKQNRFISYLREYGYFTSVDYGNIAAALAAQSGEDAQTILAVLAKLTSLGFSTVKVKGGQKGTDYDRSRDRLALVGFALGYLGFSGLLNSLYGPGQSAGVSSYGEIRARW